MSRQAVSVRREDLALCQREIDDDGPWRVSQQAAGCLYSPPALVKCGGLLDQDVTGVAASDPLPCASGRRRGAAFGVHN